MNFSEIGNLIKDYAPTVWMALSSPVGAVAAIGSIIAKALGSKNDPKSIYDAINNDPKGAEEKIKNNIELQNRSLEVIKENNRRDFEKDQHQEKMIDLSNQNTNSARINYHTTNNKIDNIIKISLSLGVFLSAAFIICILTFVNDIPKEVSVELGNTLNGCQNILFLIAGFYWGSSKKDNGISN